MGAVTLIPDPTLGTDGLSIPPTALSFLTSVAAFAILGISLLAAMLDRRAKDELHRQKILLDTALDNMSQGLCMLMRIPHPAFNKRYTEIMDEPACPPWPFAAGVAPPEGAQPLGRRSDLFVAT
jgi:hypothetical protein